MSGASTDNNGVLTTTSAARPQRSLNGQVVIEEDDYTAALSKIIARDFFPSLAHLEATNTFLSSLDSQDPDRIQESARRLAELGEPTPVRQTPHRTPYGGTPYDTPLRTLLHPGRGNLGQPQQTGPKVDTSLSLDAFQAKYTSEDNSSFTEILNEENVQRRQRYGWAWEAEHKAGEKKAKEIVGRERLLLEAAERAPQQDNKFIQGSEARKMIEDGLTAGELESEKMEVDEVEASNSRALTVVPPQSDTQDEVGPIDVMAHRKDTRSALVPSWKFKNRNSLMFSPDADESPYHPPKQVAPVNPNDATARSDPKQVIHAATRLPEQSEEVPSVPPSPTRSRIGAAISGTPYRSKEDDTPKVGGFGFVSALPSPSPSQLGPEAMKELMTWGSILATPRVISSDDDPAEPSSSSLISSRPSNPFTISEPSSRDAIGRRLGAQASKSLREKAARLSTATPRKRKSDVNDMAPPAFTPRRGGVANAEMLSPAARNLLGRTVGIGSSGLTKPTSNVPTPDGYGKQRVDLRKMGWSPASTPVSGGQSKGRGRRDKH